MAKAPRSTLLGAVISFLIGIAYLVITLPRGTVRLGEYFGSSIVISLGLWGSRVNAWIAAVFPDFQELLTWVLWAILAYLSAILILSFRHRQLSFLPWALFTLVVATGIFHVIAWGGFILIRIYQFLVRVLSIVFGWLERIIAPLVSFLVNLFNGIIDFFYQLFRPWLGNFWWVGVIAILFLLAFIIYKLRLQLAAALRAALRFSVWAVIGGGILYLLIRFWSIIVPYVDLILSFIVRILTIVYRVAILLIAAVAILIAIATIGQLFLDQFKSTTYAGNHRRGVILGAIAIGTTLGILLLVSNVYGTNSWLPGLVSQFSGEYLFQPAPTIDAIIALVIIGLSIASVLYNLPQLRKEPTLDEFGKSLVYQAVGVFVAGALIAVSSQSEQG